MSWRDRLLVTRSEAAQILSVCERTIDKLLRDGKLRGKKEGRGVRVLTASLIEYVEGATPSEPAAESAPLPPLTPEAKRALDSMLRKVLP